MKKQPAREPLQVTLKPQASKHKNVLDYMHEKRGFSRPGEKPMNILDRARLLRSRK